MMNLALRIAYTIISSLPNTQTEADDTETEKNKDEKQPAAANKCIPFLAC